MSRLERIRLALSADLMPDEIHIIDETHQHHVPAGSESHFNITVIAKQFFSQSLLQRQRLVYRLLASEFNNGLHALTMQLWSPEEWQSKQHNQVQSPPCLGGKHMDEH